MYDIKPLEEEWKQYKKNKKKPYLISLIVLVLFAVSIVTFVNYENLTIPRLLNVNNMEDLKVKVQKNSSVLLNDALVVIQIKKQEVIETVKPIVNLAVEKTKVIENNIPTLPIVDDIPVLEDKIKRKVVRKKPNIIKVSRPNVEKPRKKMHLNIIESSSVSAYKDVEKRFYQSHDTDDSLFLAKSYYRKRNYKKSEYWSLQTNKVNTNIEESWIIFAKSKVKLGRRNEAIRILTNYTKRSNSSAAKNLLYKLKKKR
jgi:hypothetical protein